MQLGYFNVTCLINQIYLVQSEYFTFGPMCYGLVYKNAASELSNL